MGSGQSRQALLAARKCPCTRVQKGQRALSGRLETPRVFSFSGPVSWGIDVAPGDVTPVPCFHDASMTSSGTITCMFVHSFIEQIFIKPPKTFLGTGMSQWRRQSLCCHGGVMGRSLCSRSSLRCSVGTDGFCEGWNSPVNTGLRGKTRSKILRWGQIGVSEEELELDCVSRATWAWKGTGLGQVPRDLAHW